MMALRQSPTEQVLFQALDGSKPPRHLSPGAMIAIGASLAAHLALVGYLATQHFSFQAPVVPEAPPMVMRTVVLSHPKPAPPAPVHRRTTAVRDVQPAQPILPVLQQSVTRLAPLQGELNAGPNIADVTPELSRGDSPPRVIVDPTWLSRPSSAELSRFYPERDIDLGLTGRASLTCGVVASGRLSDCRVVAETPARAQFGLAALKLVPYFKMSPRTVDGRPVDGGVVTFDIVFNLADGD